jgi:hypothetical protein
VSNEAATHPTCTQIQCDCDVILPNKVSNSHAHNPYLRQNFALELWVMEYGGVMGFGPKFPANQVGGHEKLWGMREYGVPRVWIMRELTVSACFASTQIPMSHRRSQVVYDDFWSSVYLPKQETYAMCWPSRLQLGLVRRPNLPLA